jgi:site-specific DNA recombinase
MNCILYARVSTDRQADKDLSIPAQLQAMREYASEHGWVVVGEFVEPGVSAKTVERPALQRMLTTLRDRDAKVGVLLVHKIDRLARNVADHATIRALLKQLGIRLASVVENVDDSVSGQLVENIMASIAQFYSANLGEEVKKGMRQKVLRGGWPHLPPTGYVQVKNGDGHGSHIEMHPRLGPLIARAFERYATGQYSLRGLSEDMAKEGLTAKTGTPIVQSQMLRILTNPFYAGRLRWKGLNLDGAHRPLVTQEVFAKVRAIVEQRYRHVGVKGTVPGFPLRAVAICASCRGRMTAERHDRWGYYRCSRQSYKKERCTARFCNAAKAHSDLLSLCATLQLTRTHAAAIRKAAKARLTAQSAEPGKRLEGLRVRDAELHRSEMELTEAFAGGSRVSAADYGTRVEELRAQRAAIANAIGGALANPSDVLKEVDRILDVATSIRDIYESLSDRKRPELLRLVFKTMVLGPDGIMGFSLTPAFEALSSKGSKPGNPVASAEALLTTTRAA